MPRIEINLPDDVAGGVYADFAAVWHSRDVFTLDFAAVTNPARASEEKPEEPVTKARIVTRVRIPPGQVFELMKALEQELTKWEQQNPGRRNP